MDNHYFIQSRVTLDDNAWKQLVNWLGSEKTHDNQDDIYDDRVSIDARHSQVRLQWVDEAIDTSLNVMIGK